MFPVPPSGTAKFRIGITAPLTLTNDGRATLALPAIVDRNFSIDAVLRHAVWIEGDGREVSADAGFSAIAGEKWRRPAARQLHGSGARDPPAAHFHCAQPERGGDRVGRRDADDPA
jgi:hypothetical protein